jgi:transposase
MALFDLSSAWVEGRHCPLAARGYSRDGKKGKAQIEYGLLTDPHGRPVAVRVFTGDTADPAAFVEAVTVVRDKFGLADLVMVGDRGMITSARIDALREHTELGWLTCLRAPAIAKLAADDGPLQMTLFDQQDLAEITHPDYPGERLIACRNPLIYVLRTSVPADQLDAPEVVTAYKNLSYVERDFRHIKADDLALRPIHHRLEDRVKAHVLICMLAAYLVWHLRAVLAPLTYTDTQPLTRDNPVTPARRSATAARKASRHRDEADQPVRSFRALLAHLGTLTRNRIHINGTEFDQLTEPTPTQRRAFELLATPIPITLT